MKLKNVFVFIIIITFLGSCKPYKSVLEKEKENELIKNSIQSDYEIENIYKINKKSTLELNLQEGKKYKFQYFSKRYFDMILLDSQSEIIAMNKISYVDSSYRTKTIIFDCKNTGKYNLKLSGKYFLASPILVVSKQNIDTQIDKEKKYTFIRGYTVVKRPYPEMYDYTCVFSKGTTYKFTLEEGVTRIFLHSGNYKKTFLEFDLNSNNNEFVYECKNTNVYHLEAVNYVEGKISKINLFFNRSDSTKTNTILLYSHYLYDEVNEHKKAFAADTDYFFMTKGCGEEIKVEILDKDLKIIEKFYFKNGNERFVFKNKALGIYHIKVTKMNPNDNHETTLIIEQ